MSDEREIPEGDFDKLLKDVKKWCAENQAAIGVGEMLAGSALIAWGVHNGAIAMGAEVVGTEMHEFNTESLTGATSGSAIGAVAGSILGSIGVAGMGGAIGIPAALVIGGATALLGMVGYSVGDILNKVTDIPIDYTALAASGGLLLLGTALIIDGANRCIKGESFASSLPEYKIYLNKLSVKIIARTKEELYKLIEEPEAALGATLGAASGLAVGSTVAAGSVTVLGSHALGGVAVTLGIASAPLWPVIAGVAGGAGLGYAAYKATKHWRKSATKDLDSNTEPQI